METIKRLVDRFLNFWCIVLCGGLTVVVTWQVVARYLFQSPGAQSEEYAKIMFVWLVLFATALLFGEKGHMNIAIVCEKMPPAWNACCQVVTSLVILGFAALVLLVGGLNAVGNTMEQTNAAIPYLTTGQIYLALPICGLFTIFYCIYNLRIDLGRLLALRTPAQPAPRKD